MKCNVLKITSIQRFQHSKVPIENANQVSLSSDIELQMQEKRKSDTINFNNLIYLQVLKHGGYCGKNESIFTSSHSFIRFQLHRSDSGILNVLSIQIELSSFPLPILLLYCNKYSLIL